MLGCLGREATVAVSVVDCVASVVDYEAHPMEDAEVMDVVGTQLAVATSRTRICIRITRVRTSRRVDTAVERMMEVLLEGTGGYESEPSQQIMVRNVSKFRVISDPVADPISSTFPADSEPGNAMQPPLPTPYVPYCKCVRPHSIDISNLTFPLSQHL